MKNYQAKKALSVLLAVLMLLTSVYAGLGVIASAASVELNTVTALEDGTVYTVTTDTAITGGTNGLSIPANATVIIDIAAGATLTVKGGSANGTTAGKAGILMNSGSKLIFTGSGTLKVAAGKGGDGGNGGNNNGTTGGGGGAGGAGGGAAIGTNGGASGSAAAAWPNNASVTVLCNYSNATPSSNNGSNGSGGTQGSGSSDGGAGGGGGLGKGGAPIGTGGGGGANGGNGTDGSSGCSNSRGTSGGTGSAGSNATAQSYSTNDPFAAMRTILAAKAELLNETQAQQLEHGYDALAADYNEIVTEKANVDSYGADVFDYYFGAYTAKIEQLEASKTIAEYVPIVERINGYLATDISGFNKAALTEIYNNLTTDYNSYKAINIDKVYAYFETDNTILVRATVEAKYEEIEDAYEIAVLREDVKPQIEADLAIFNGYDQDWVLATDNAGDLLNAAKTALTGYEDSLGTYKAKNVDAVFGENYVATVFGPLRTNLEKLLVDNNYKVQFASYKTVYTQVFENLPLDSTTDQLYAVLSARDSWYTQLLEYIETVRAYDANLADRIMATTGTAMQNKIDSVYAQLNSRVEAQINNAYDLYMGFVAEYGYTINTSDDITVQNYNALKTAFGQLNPDHYSFLLNTDHFDVSEETVAKYEEIKNAVFAFVNYDATKGLSAYEYNIQKANDVLRTVSEYDQVRNLDYTVDEEKRATAYENVKKILDSDLLKESLGFDLNKTVGDLLDGLPEKLYTDDFVNTLVQYLYPLVTTEFAKVWDDLPSTTHIDDPVSVDIKLSIYKLDAALRAIGLPLLPQLLASNVRSAGFNEAANKLEAVTTVTKYTFERNTDGSIKMDENGNKLGAVTADSWTDANIYDAETQKLTLVWGVTDRESFLNAISAAFSGLEGLLKALLSNLSTTYGGSNAKIGTGSGNFSCVTIKVDPITLKMTFGGNPGYDNAIAPILSALGVDSIPEGNTLTTTRKIIENGLILPIVSLLEKLKDEPLDTIFDILPNLAYALNFNLVTPLLNELKTTIAYTADAVYDAGIGGSGTKEGALKDSLSINVGEMLDLKSLGIDLSAPSKLIKSLIDMLNKSDAAEGESAESEEPTGIAAVLNELDLDKMFKKIAYMGEGIAWKPGNRTVTPFDWEGHEHDFPRIIANRSEIFAYLIENILSILSSDLVNDLLKAFAEEGEEPTALPDIANTIIDNIAADPNDAIAAIVELMIPQEYNNWAELETPATTFTYGDDETEVTPAEVAYLKYANDWNKPTATAIATNVDELIPAIAALLKKDVSLNAMLQDALKGVFTKANLDALADMIAGLELPAALTEGVVADLLDEIGLDLGALIAKAQAKDWSFADGNKAAFVAALCDLLDPLAPVLKIMLPGENLSALDGVINVNGYDVYPNSFGLIFDALGVPQITGYEDMTASEELEAILNALLAKVDALTAEGNSMIEDVLEMLPGVVYFIESNGLSVAIKNLIYPMQIVIDTIRPIYSVDLFEMIGGLLAGTGLELNLDDLKMSTILNIVDAQFGTTLATSPLGTYAIPALTIKHGSLDAADVLTILLCGVIEAFETESVTEGVTNGEVILGLIGNEKVTEIYTNLVPLITGGESEIDPDKITPINWTYMYGGEIQLDSFEMPEYTNEAVINYLSTYEKNQWTSDLAEYLNDNLDSIVADVLRVAGQEPNLLTTLISGLINDKLYTADVVNAAGTAIYDLLGNLENQLKVVIDAMLGTEIAGKTYTPVASVNGKADFIAKMEAILNPFNRILGFVLFGQSYKFFNGTTREDLIVLNGGDAYDAALVPVLEALGVTMPKKDTFTSTGDAIHKVLTAVTDRLDEIAEGTKDEDGNVKTTAIDEILLLLPNVLYFLNADGIKAVINNAVLPFDALVEAVTGNPIATLLAGVEVGGVALNDLDTMALLTLIEGLADITIPDVIKEAISSFYIGKAVKYPSANGKLAFKLAYDGDRKDMITILASVLIEVLAYEDNAKILKGVSEEAYQTVLNILGKSDTDLTVPMKVPDWLYWEAADTDQVFSAINTSTEFGAYGPLFTQDMAVYIANNLDSFIDNLIYLLGIPADALEGLGIHTSTDEYITSLKDLLNTVIGDTIYTTDIADVLLNLVEEKLVQTVNGLTINGVAMGDIVKNVLKTALKVDLDRYTNGEEFTRSDDGKYHVQPFESGSKEGFLNALVQILDPLYPVLNWLLCEEDISFFTDSAGNDQITLKGGQGYKYGIIPILETFDCTDLPTQEAVSATTDTASLVNTIATPLLSRIDKILENPVDEIFELLPNVAYFINSKGLDACVRNMVNAINVVLKALQPLVGDVDLFAAIGIDLATIDMQYIMNAITDKLGEDSDLAPLVVDALAEMTTGKIVTSSSQSELTPWYKMEYAGETSKADTITTLLRFALRWVALNAEKLKPLVREKIEMSDEGYAYIDKLIDIVAAYAGTNSGMDSLLHMLYYIFYGIHNGSASVAGWQRDYNSRFEAIAEGQKAATKTDENLGKVAELLDWLFVTYGDGDKDDTGNVYHNYDDDEMGSPAAGKPKGFAPNGFIAFFRQIIEWFKTIFNKIFKH